VDGYKDKKYYDDFHKFDKQQKQIHDYHSGKREEDIHY